MDTRNYKKQRNYVINLKRQTLNNSVNIILMPINHCA